VLEAGLTKTGFETDFNEIFKAIFLLEIKKNLQVDQKHFLALYCYKLSISCYFYLVLSLD
jgi:hypothetical protein